MRLHPSDYVGIAFVDRGRDPGQGLDCWGLVRHWYFNERGILLPSLDDAPSAGHQPERIPELIREQALQWRSVTDIESGDVLHMRVAGQPHHVGVYVGLMGAARCFLHTLPGQGSAYCEVDSPRWRPGIVGAYRHVG